MKIGTLDISKIYLGSAESAKVYLGSSVVYEEQTGSRIYYTTTDGNIITPTSASSIDGNIVSNTYVDGQGCMVFDTIITTIGTNTFRNIGTLQTMMLPSSITTIGYEAFLMSRYITKIILENGVSTIGRNAFENCNRLSYIQYNGTISQWNQISIDSTWKNASRLRVVSCTDGNIDLSPNSLMTTTVNVVDVSQPTVLSSSVLSKYFPIMSVDGGQYFDTISAYTFNSIGEHTVTYYAISNEFDGGDFKNCTQLTSLIIPNDIIFIRSKVCQNCTSLNNVTFPIRNDYQLDGANFEGCSSLQSVNITSGITKIGGYVFKNCTSLSSITISNTINILAYSFAGNVFEGCPATSITYEGTIAEWNSFTKSDNWKNGSNITTIHCTDGDITL